MSWDRQVVEQTECSSSLSVLITVCTVRLCSYPCQEQEGSALRSSHYMQHASPPKLAASQVQICPEDCAAFCSINFCTLGGRGAMRETEQDPQHWSFHFPFPRELGAISCTPSKPLPDETLIGNTAMSLTFQSSWMPSPELSTGGYNIVLNKDGRIGPYGYRVFTWYRLRDSCNWQRVEFQVPSRI